MFLPLHPQKISSSFCLFAAKLGIGVFGKDNVRKSRRDDLESIGADIDGGTRANNPGKRTNADAGADNPNTAINNLGTAADNPSTATDDPSIVADNLGTKTDADAEADNSGIATAIKPAPRPSLLYVIPFFCLPLPLN